LWEDELPSDESPPSPQDDGDHSADSAAVDQATDNDYEEPSNCVVSEGESHEVENEDADLDGASVEDPSEQAADESESGQQQQECLISFDDDVESGGPAADEVAAECDVEKCEGDDVPSDSACEDLVADVNAVVPDDDVGVEESSTGDM